MNKQQPPVIPVYKILEQTQRKAVLLIVVVPVDVIVIVVEFTVPRVVCIVLGRRPKVRVVA